MKCVNCGREINDGSRFCVYCGAKQPYRCIHCGREIPETSRFCPYCGQDQTASNDNGDSDSRLSPSPAVHTTYDDPLNPEENSTYTSSYQSYGTERNIALCIVFSIITFGIYGLYWMVKLNNEINELADEPEATSGGMVILLEIITCNIYGWYWCYKMGQRTVKIKEKLGRSGESNLIYVLFALFGLNIVSYALMQDTINEAVRSGM